MNWIRIVPFSSFLIIVIALLIKIIVLKKQGIVIRSVSAKKSNPILRISFLLLFLIWLSEIVNSAFFESLSVLPTILTKTVLQADFLTFAGTIVITIALILWVITLFHFKTSLRFGLEKNTSGKLIKTGIFSISRNPFFLSLNIYFVGLGLLIPNIFFIGFAILSIISIHFFIIKEEGFLKATYGKEYDEYKKKVRRYF